MKNTANILIVIGGGLVLIPFAYLYFSHRLVSQILSELIVRGQTNPTVDLTPILPNYYIPVCLLLGIACIGIGIFFAGRENKED